MSVLGEYEQKYERASTKDLGNALSRYTELYTIFTGIEAAQSSLAYPGSNPLNPRPITPSQLAIGRNIRGRGNVSVGKSY